MGFDSPFLSVNLSINSKSPQNILINENKKQKQKIITFNVVVRAVVYVPLKHVPQGYGEGTIVSDVCLTDIINEVVQCSELLNQ